LGVLPSRDGVVVKQKLEGVPSLLYCGQLADPPPSAEVPNGESAGPVEGHVGLAAAEGVATSGFWGLVETAELVT
jgi:hypothetical protein